MKKKLPVGTQDYYELRIQDYYTVDKTMMIQEFLERGSKVTLITRPRRFGKTLNMSMMAEFFDITKDSKALFEGLAIMDTPYAKEMNQHPVIFVSFANAKGNMAKVVKVIKEEIVKEYKRYKSSLIDMDEFDQPFYDAIIHSLRDPWDKTLYKIEDSLSFLSRKVEEYYGKKVYIFIDEYDTPFIHAQMNGFYNEIHNELGNFFSTTLKGNSSMNLALLTGIQRIAKENIFSGLNNLKVCTVGDKPYSQHFGFTIEETKDLLEYYNLALTDEVKQMYDGYQFGDIEIYNPWSVINYGDTKELKAYWVNTSSNELIMHALRKVDASFFEEYEELIEKNCLTTNVDMVTSFFEDASLESLWGLLVNAGYLTIDETIDLEESIYTLRIPNREVLGEFKKFTAYHLNTETKDLQSLSQSIFKKDEALFLNKYRKILLSNPSYYDLKDENSYHMLLLGICLYLQNDFEVISNREVGNGRCDMMLKAKKTSLPTYVIEMKYATKEMYEKDVNCLKVLAQKAIEQIQIRQYDYNETGEVIMIGLAHCGKHVEMKWMKR